MAYVDIGSSSKKDWSPTSAFIKERERRRKLLEEEEEKRKDEEETKQIAKEQEQQKGGLETALAGVSEFGKNIWDETTKRYTQLAEGVGESIGEVTGENDKIREQQRKQQEDELKFIEKGQAVLQDPNASAEVKARWKKSIQKIASNSDAYKTATEYNERQEEVTDPVRGAANVVGVGVDILSGGTLAGLRAAKTGADGLKIAKAASKTGRLTRGADDVAMGTSERIARQAGAGAALEGAYSPIRQYGDDREINLQDTAADVTFGAILGGGAGALDGALTRGSRREAAEKLARDSEPLDGVDDVARSIDAEEEFAATRPEQSQLMLGSGEETARTRLKEIEDLEAAVRVGENQNTSFAPGMAKGVDDAGTSDDMTALTAPIRERWARLEEDTGAIQQEIDDLRTARSEAGNQKSYIEASKNIEMEYRQMMKEAETLPPLRQDAFIRAQEARLMEKQEMIDEKWANKDKYIQEFDQQIEELQTQRFDLEQQAQLEMDELGKSNAIMQAERMDTVRNMSRDQLIELAEEKRSLQRQLDDIELSKVADDPTLNTAKVAETRPEVKGAMTRQVAEIEDSLYTSVDPDFDVGFLGGLSTPERVFRSAGLAKEFNIVRNGYDNYNRALNLHHKEMTEWADDIGRSSKSSEKIGQWLDGNKVSLTPQEELVAESMKDSFARYAEILGVPQEQRISDYFPHLWKDMEKAAKYDPELQRILQNNASAKINNKFLKRRLGKEGYSFDAFTAYDVYMKKALQQEHLGEGLAVLKGAEKKVSNSMGKYINRQINIIKNTPDVQTQLTKQVDDTLVKLLPWHKQGDLSKRSSQARSLVYLGTLGGNVGSAFRNLSQNVNTYSLLGEKWTTVGMGEASRHIMTQNGKAELIDMGVLDDTYKNVLADGDFNAMQNKAVKAGSDALWWMFNTAEELNRATAYYGAKNRALSKGASLDEAKKAGAAMARKTQFKFSPIDTPQVLNGPIVKNATQFMSFNIKQVEFLKDRLVGETDSLFTKGKNGRYKLTKQGAASMLRFTGGATAFSVTAGALIGMEAEDWVPFYREVTSGTLPTSPITALVLGNEQTTGLGNVLRGENKYGAEEDRLSLAGKVVTEELPGLFIPGGTQGKKTLEGLEAVDRGYSETAAGRVRFGIEGDVDNATRAGLFGQYNTREGQEFYKDGFFGLGSNQGESMSIKETQMYKEASPAKRDMYEAFFQANDQIKDRDAVDKEVTRIIKEEKNINKAKRKAQEYNAEVESTFESLLAEYNGMIPEELLEYVESKKLNSLEKNLKARDR